MPNKYRPNTYFLNSSYTKSIVSQLIKRQFIMDSEVANFIKSEEHIQPDFFIESFYLCTLDMFIEQIAYCRVNKFVIHKRNSIPGRWKK